MKTFARFKSFNPLTNNTYFPCSSDSVFKLDGRNNIKNMIQNARERMKQLSKVQDYIGGVIVQVNSLQDLDTYKEKVIGLF